MQTWTEAMQDILVGLAIIAAVAAAFVVGPLLAHEQRAKLKSRRYGLGPDRVGRSASHGSDGTHKEQS